MFNFITCPIEHPAEDGQGMSIGNLLKTPVFIISILLMICAGASELSMAQWASAFAESALDLSKALPVCGDYGNKSLTVWKIRRQA